MSAAAEWLMASVANIARAESMGLELAAQVFRDRAATKAAAIIAAGLEMTGAEIPETIRPKLQALRAEFARRTVERAPGAWARLHTETKVVLLMLAGVDGAQDQDLDALAFKDWREFSPSERARIGEAADALRWQLNGARDLCEV